MYFVRFTPPRVIEYEDVRSFQARARLWLNLREGENTYLIGSLALLDRTRDPSIRMFTIEQEETIVAAGVLVTGGCLCMTWATQDVITILAEHAIRNYWKVTSTCAPAHISVELAKALAEKTQQVFTTFRSERIFQLTHLDYPLPENGRLEVAHDADKPLVTKWFHAFVQDAHFIGDVAQDPKAVDWLVDPRRMYLWKAPEPVAMAAWVAPSMNGGCINYVYVPPEHRGKGYGKAITAALGGQMLASGLKYCFILTDSADVRSNHVYQSVGARSLCDILHCNLTPGPQGPHISNNGGARSAVASRT